jgi:long-chain acyl-CoA synthetase
MIFRKEMMRVIEHSEAELLVLEKQSQWKKVKTELGQLSHLRLVIVREAVREHDLVISWRQFSRKGEAYRADLEAEIARRRAAVLPETLATIIYTQGTEAGPIGQSILDAYGIYYLSHSLQECRLGRL